MKCAKICPSEFDTPFVVEDPTIVEDDCGGDEQKTWLVKISPLWCKFVEKSGGETFVQHGQQVRARCEITTHFRTDINENMRLVDENGIYYNIKRVKDIEKKHQYLLITTELGEPDG